MKILITGTSSGIGLAAARKFLHSGHEVIGIDKQNSAIDDKNYTHFIADVAKKESLPDIDGIEVAFLNAGTQNSGDDIKNNLVGTINAAEKYALCSGIRSVLFNASASAVSGSEFPEYAASKAGILGYMKNLAIRLAPEGVTVNAISLGGVMTSSNAAVMNDKKLWDKIMSVTPLKKWATLDEVAEWVYFLTVINKSMSGENVLIDNGEYKLNQTFVWPEE